MGHALGAPHSFASGGLMSYTGEAAFSATESAEVCAPISSHLANPNLDPITDPNP